MFTDADFVGVVRLSILVILLAVFALLEIRWPLRPVRGGWRHAGINLAVAVAATLAARLLVPITLIGVAFYAQREGLGLFHQTNASFAVAFIGTLVALDFLTYALHRVKHAWQPLWRLHRVHHSDEVPDVTTALRFHPGEIIVSLLATAPVVLILGATPGAVLVFEVLLNSCALFNHANFALPNRIDRWLRWILVTPAMHAVHHSIEVHESRHNFGFSVSWWDRLLGTYLEAPAAGYKQMRAGVDGTAQLGGGFADLMKQPWRHLTPLDSRYCSNRAEISDHCAG